MATTIDEVAAFLEAKELRFRKARPNVIAVGFGGLDNYRDEDGDAQLAVFIELDEDGEYIKIFAPKAYVIPPEKAGPVLQLCAMIQWRTKLVQFEYDASDGELRPIVEFPLEDAHLTAQQLHRCVAGLVQIVDEFHPSIQTAIDSGEINLPDPVENLSDMLGQFLGGFPPDLLADALLRSEAHRRRN